MNAHEESLREKMIRRCVGRTVTHISVDDWWHMEFLELTFDDGSKLIVREPGLTSSPNGLEIDGWTPRANAGGDSLPPRKETNG